MTETPPSPQAPPNPDPWTPVARLLRPQGRRGELLADPLTDLPGVLAPGRRLAIAPASGAEPASSAAPAETTIDGCWSPTGRNAGRIVLKLAGIDTISAAELLAGRELLIASAQLPELEPDTWFVRDLLGCRLFDGRRLVGEITGIEYPMASDGRTRLSDATTLLEVTIAPHPRSNEADPQAAVSQTALIPFVKAWLESVDIAQKRVLMHLPAGLLGIDEQTHMDAEAC